MDIYIIRHGETCANQQGIFQGWRDDPLNDFGIQLAEEAGKGLKNIHFDAAFSSPLSRAKQTCEIILKETGNDCSIVLDDRIKEIHMGDFEGKKASKDIIGKDDQFFECFFTDPKKCGKFPNGESVQEVMDRTQEFIHEIAKLDYARILVASHGCAIRCMLNFLYDDNDNFWHGKVPANCCINILNVRDGKISLIGDDVIFYDKQLLVDRFPLPIKDRA